MSGRSEHNRRAFAWLGLLPPRDLDTSRDPDQLEPVRWRSVRALPGVEPDGCLHHGKRGRMVLRYTTAGGAGSLHLAEALARVYVPHREVRLMALLRPHQLDDAFWRMVLALLTQGGGRVRIAEVVAMVCRLTWERDVALAEAERLYRSWLREVRSAEAEQTT